jgi:hypothetical protein
MGMGWLPTHWLSSVPSTHPVSLDWRKMGGCAQILAHVAQKSLSPQVTWQKTLGLGQIQARWSPPVPIENASAQQQRSLAKGAFLLAHVEEE